MSLYVGDLDFNVTDSQFYDLFNQVGQVVSVRIYRDLSTRRTLGCGYAKYSNPQDAARAMDVLNFTPLNGKPIRIMYSHRDPSIHKSSTANIFIKVGVKAARAAGMKLVPVPSLQNAANQYYIADYVLQYCTRAY